jgi:protein associated with RNAse G/E
MWNEGDRVLLRGMYEDRPAYVQSTRVVKDTPQETALLIWPGAECMVPNGYLHHAHSSEWDRWQDTLANSLDLKKFLWRTNRFLILLEPEKFYSTIYIWEAATDRFDCYYINFQLPFHRTRLGFDTLDLDLDLVIEASYDWKWKDEDEFQHGINSGGIKLEWVREIEQAKQEVLARLEKRIYPLDAKWLSWRPDPAWSPPSLPEDWNAVD